MQLKLLLQKFLAYSKKVFSILLVAFAGFILLYFLDDAFLVKTIEVFVEEEKQDIYGLHHIALRNIFFTSEKSVEQIMVDNNPLVKAVRVQKIYPSTIRITPYFDEVIAALKVSEDGFFLLSEQGKVLSKTKENRENLPQLVYYQLLQYALFQNGETISYKDILMALHFLKKSRDLDLYVNSIDITSFSMIGLYVNGGKILFTTEKEQSVQDFQFETIVKQFKVEGKNFSVLDLRFDKPVVIFR